MITQKQVAVVLQTLPQAFSIAELVDKLILVEKIEQGIREGERGETYSSAEARKLLRQWLK